MTAWRRNIEDERGAKVRDARVRSAAGKQAPQWMRQAFRDLRVERSGPGREAAAIGLGLFLGCLPFYGFHLLLCWVFGWLFRLNRLKVYLAANVSNPFVAPWLIFAELQTGAWLRHGSFQNLTPHALRATGIGVIGVDLLAGSVAVGLVLAVLAATATYALLNASRDDAVFVELVRRASDRYVRRSITAWEFARGKLRRDPIYRAALFGGLLPSGGMLIDVGCGQGLMLALLAEVRSAVHGDAWPTSAPIPPQFDRMIGIEIRPRVAASAQAALGADAEIVQGDARTYQISGVRVVLLFDVLHMMDRKAQDAMLAGMASILDPGGVLLIREADAAGGWRFLSVRIGNTLKAFAFGARGQRFHFRTRAEWLDCFAQHGFRADVRAMGGGTPFANVLFSLRARE